MISNNGLKRKSLDHHHLTSTGRHTSTSTLTKRFRGAAYDGKINQQHEHRMSLLATKVKSEQHEPKKLAVSNGEPKSNNHRRLNESEMTPAILAEYRRLQHELQCQEALLVLMQKLKTNQRLVPPTSNNNNGIKQRTSTPTTATKLNQQIPMTDGKTPLAATKQQPNHSNRSTPTKSPHPNQYTGNRPNSSAQIAQQQQQQSAKNSLPAAQATRQSNHNTNHASLPAAATRLPSTVPASATKNSSATSNTSSSSKSNGVAAEQHLLNAKMALRKQLEQTLLQIPTPKPSTCDLTFIPGVNGWSEFLAHLGLEQAINTYMDIVLRRNPSDMAMTLPHVCAQCGTDWSVTWHEMSSGNDTSSDEKILCDRCSKTSQKKLLKQDHSNRLRQAFIKALQQEKELDAKFQHQSPTSTTTTTTSATPSTAVKQSSSSSQPSSKHSHHTSKHSNKPLSTKTSSNHHHHHHHHHHNHNSTHNSNNHHSHSHHHHHSGKSNSSSSSKGHSSSLANMSALAPSPAETLASTLAALQSTEQMEFFQKHFLSNMLPYAVANQAAALAAKSSHHQQQQQQAALAALPAMAASLMRQPNPAQYLLDMIPQAAKQQQQQQHHHHHHSK